MPVNMDPNKRRNKPSSAKSSEDRAQPTSSTKPGGKKEFGEKPIRIVKRRLPTPNGKICGMRLKSSTWINGNDWKL